MYDRLLHVASAQDQTTSNPFKEHTAAIVVGCQRQRQPPPQFMMPRRTVHKVEYHIGIDVLNDKTSLTQL